ncbi:amidase domain-containing protein [Metabacillus halosaccharovorans]|uniref:Amidase domain-containing protein n=2 Tax=Metabacillus halosaccharovorans TaxID=930124 RepID=A0ABT3DJU4_9BACI|nr:amidase domain-containing protein [Metabacillus halosaccharovorans]MCV9887323.1 amidase domain-containing protein [Metabacillus halosaccharovorans]
MKQQLTEINEARLQMLINAKHIKNERNDQELQAIERKLQSAQKRKTEIIKGNSKIQIINLDKRTDHLKEAIYACHNKWLHKQKDLFYLEERIEYRKASFYQDELVDDQLVTSEGEKDIISDIPVSEEVRNKETDFRYDRMAAVQYAERWWNSSNPQYKNFDVNCTNFISQCLHAGGAKMRGYPNRSNGWWMQSNNWSYSWTVAHSMKTFLSNSRTGLRAEVVSSPEQLVPGDVICYDFQGDGRYDHTTFVVAKDEENMPLVNAQTYNSRMRYWAYEDSTAYTPNIKYAFFRILDDTSSK